jgi:hypothetical protein
MGKRSPSVSMTFSSPHHQKPHPANGPPANRGGHSPSCVGSGRFSWLRGTCNGSRRSGIAGMSVAGSKRVPPEPEASEMAAGIGVATVSELAFPSRGERVSRFRSRWWPRLRPLGRLRRFRREDPRVPEDRSVRNSSLPSLETRHQSSFSIACPIRDEVLMARPSCLKWGMTSRSSPSLYEM